MPKLKSFRGLLCSGLNRPRPFPILCRVAARQHTHGGAWRHSAKVSELSFSVSLRFPFPQPTLDYVCVCVCVRVCVPGSFCFHPSTHEKETPGEQREKRERQKERKNSSVVRSRKTEREKEQVRGVSFLASFLSDASLPSIQPARQSRRKWGYLVGSLVTGSMTPNPSDDDDKDENDL